MRIAQDVGSTIRSKACGLASATAGSTGDATKITGATIDRKGFGSAQVAVAYKTTLAEGKTLSLAAEIQDSDDGTNWSSAEALYTATVVETGGAGGSAGVVGEKRTDIDLSRFKRYVRVNVTPDLSATDTDTAIVSTVIVLGGAVTLPVAFV